MCKCPCHSSFRCRCNLDDNAAYSEQSQDLCATTFSSSPQDAPLLSGTSPGANYWPNDTTQKPASGNSTPNKNRCVRPFKTSAETNIALGIFDRVFVVTELDKILKG